MSLLRAPPRTASAWITEPTIALANHAAADLPRWSTLVPLPRTWPTLGAGVLVLITLGGAVPLTRPWLQHATWTARSTQQ